MQLVGHAVSTEAELYNKFVRHARIEGDVSAREFQDPYVFVHLFVSDTPTCPERPRY
jgi:hypothetical protein